MLATVFEALYPLRTHIDRQRRRVHFDEILCCRNHRGYARIGLNVNVNVTATNTSAVSGTTQAASCTIRTAYPRAEHRESAACRCPNCPASWDWPPPPASAC